MIATGTYQTGIEKVEGIGGCTFEVKKGIIKKEKWHFWDEHNNQIEGDEALISDMEHCKPIWIKIYEQ